MSGITTVIFDIYETLVPNRQEQWLIAFQEVCHKQRLPISPQALWQEWKSLETTFRQGRVNIEAPEKSPPFKTYTEAWRDDFHQTFDKLGLKGDPDAAARIAVEHLGRRETYEDVKESLPRIQAQWRTGVLSNADDAFLLPLLKRHGLKFHAVLSSEGARAYKPHPSAFHQIMDRLGVVPSEAVFLGDNPYDDIQGARLVGIRAVWLNRNGGNYDSSMPAPDAQISSLAELPDVLERLQTHTARGEEP